MPAGDHTVVSMTRPRRSAQFIRCSPTGREFVLRLTRPATNATGHRRIRLRARTATDGTSNPKAGSSPAYRPPRPFITALTKRRRFQARFVAKFNTLHGTNTPWPPAVRKEWVHACRLAHVDFPDAS